MRVIRHVLHALAVVVVAAACGGNSSDADRRGVDVEFTRADGSLVTFSDTVRAWCGPYDDESPDTQAVHVMAGERLRGKPPTALWIMSAVRADVERDPVTRLPNSFVSTEPQGASLFAYDAEDRKNELSSGVEEARGTISVELDGCDQGDTVGVEFEDVVLGSEYFDLPSVSVEGSVVAEIER